MIYSAALFRRNEAKTTTLTIRLTPHQKDCIYELANQKKLKASRFILDLVGLEYERESKLCNNDVRKKPENKFTNVCLDDDC